MTTSRHPNRKRFPTWLRELVDGGEVSGVYWLDDEKTKFRVPWTRVDSPDFDLPRDALLFQKWAEFTGRYKKGERTDPSVWKTRFRCAIRKMTEIEELKAANNLEVTNGEQPFRVFRFKQEANRPKRKDVKQKQRYRRSTTTNTEPVSYDQYHLRRSRHVKRGVTIGVTRSLTQNWSNNEPIDATARTDQSLTEVNGVTPDGLKRYVTQSRDSMANSVTPHATPIGLMNSVTQSTLYSNTHDGLLQDCYKVFLGQNPRDTPYCTNFDTSVKYCMSQPSYYSNTMYQLGHTPIDDNFVRVSSWPNQCYSEDGQACLPSISLQEIKSVLLACDGEQAAGGPQGDDFLGAASDADALAATTHSPTFANDYEAIGSDPFFESQDCQEAYSTTLMLNDLNEILQPSSKIESAVYLADCQKPQADLSLRTQSIPGNGQSESGVYI